MNNGGSDVNVRFGGDTRGLDDATRRARSDIASMQPTVQGLGQTLGKMKGQVTDAFTNPQISHFRQEMGHAASGTRANALQIRESLVLMREASVGNFTRMAGSASILAGSLASSQMSVGSLAKSLLTMAGMLKVTTDAELVEEAANASAAATAVKGAVARSAAAILAADTEVILAEAAVRAAVTSEEEALAAARLATALKAVATASAEAAIAQNAYAVAADRAAVASEASAAATVTKVTGRVYALAAAVTLIVGTVVYKSVMKFGESMSTTADQIGKLSAKANMTASEFGGWAEVARHAEIDTKSLATTLVKLQESQVRAANGGRRQIAVFNELGISVKESRTQNELMLAMADKFSKMEDGPKKTAIAFTLMGQKGVELIPIFNQGREALEKQMQTAKDYGAVMSDELVAAGQRVKDAMEESDLAMTGLKNTLFEALAPAIQVTVEYFNGLVKEMVASYRSGGLVKTIVEAIVIAFKGMVTVIATVILAFQELYHAAMAALTPIVGTLSAVIQGVGDAISGNWSGALTRFKDHMANVAQNTIGHVKDMKNSAVDYGNTLARLWGEKGLGVPKPRPATMSGDLNIPGFGPKGPKPKKPKKNNDALQAAVEEIEFKKDMARDDFDEQMRLEDQKLALLKAYYGEDSQEYKRALREKLKMKRDHDQEIVQLERDQIKLREQIAQNTAEADKEVQDQILEQRRQAIEFDAQNGRISEQRKIQMLAQVTGEQQRLERESARRIYEIQRAAFLAELALQNLRPPERQKILNQMELAEAKFAADMRVINARQASEAANVSNQAAQSVINKWKGIVAPISSAFGQMFQSLYMRQSSFKQAMLAAADSIVLHWAQKGIEWLANWTAMQLAGKGVMAATKAAEVAIHAGAEVAKTTATVVGETTRVAATATGAAASKAITLSSVLMEIGAKAANAAAGAYAAISSIPYVGPFLAPAVAGGILVAVLALGSKIASAEGGWGQVPKDGMMTELHKDEMVLPAKFANPLRQSLTGGLGVGPVGVGARAGATAGGMGRDFMSSFSGGDNSFQYSPHIDHHDMSLADALAREGREFRRWFNNQVRNGALRPPEN